MVNNSGGSWHSSSALSCSSTTNPCPSGRLPNRYISGVRMDTATPSHAYLSLSGYSRKWMIGPDDPGAGHVFETTTGGSSWTDRSGNLPDVPTDDVVFRGGILYAATDFGVFRSSDNGASWTRLRTNLPPVLSSHPPAHP